MMRAAKFDAKQNDKLKKGMEKALKATDKMQKKSEKVLKKVK